MRKRTKHKGIIQLGPQLFEIRVQRGYDRVTKRYRQWMETFHGTLQGAFQRRIAMMDEVKQGRVAVTGWTMDQLMAEHFRYVEGKNAPQTVRNDKERWGILQPILGDIKLQALDARMLDQVLDTMQRDRKLKNQTVNRYRALLSAAFENARRWKAISHNPVRDTHARTEVPYDGQLADFKTIKWVLDAYETRDPAMGQLLRLSLLNSLRRGEACGLQAGDYDPEAKTLWIRRSISGNFKEDLTIKPPKTLQTRLLGLDDISVEIIEARLAYCTKPDSFLFSDDGGKTPWIPNRVTFSQRRMRNRICAKCGAYNEDVEKKCQDCGGELGVYWRVHDLRAFTTTFLIEQGLSKLAQQRGGWSNEVAMRKFYNKFTQHSSEAAVAAINQRFGEA